MEVLCLSTFSQLFLLEGKKEVLLLVVFILCGFFPPSYFKHIVTEVLKLPQRHLHIVFPHIETHFSDTLQTNHMAKIPEYYQFAYQH